MTRTSFFKLFSLCVLLFSCLLLFACQGINAFYQGYTADEKNVITLANANSAEGVWKTFDLTLDYTYAYAGTTLDISGAASPNDFYEMHTSRIESLDLYIFFLDNDSKVLETAQLAQALGPKTDQLLNFNHKLKAPAGTTAFAFGYDGVAHGDGGGETGGILEGGGNREFFYDLPKRKAPNSES